MPYLDTTGLTRLVANLKNFLVPKTRTINGAALDKDIVLTAANIPMTDVANEPTILDDLTALQTTLASGAPGQAFMASPEGTGHI